MWIGCEYTCKKSLRAGALTLLPADGSTGWPSQSRDVLTSSADTQAQIQGSAYPQIYIIYERFILLVQSCRISTAQGSNRNGREQSW